MKEEILHRTLWRTLFGRGYGTCCLDRRLDGDEIIVICHVKCVGCRGNNTQYSHLKYIPIWYDALDCAGLNLWKISQITCTFFFGIRKCSASNMSHILIGRIVSFESHRVKQFVLPWSYLIPVRLYMRSYCVCGRVHSSGILRSVCCKSTAFGTKYSQKNYFVLYCLSLKMQALQSFAKSGNMIYNLCRALVSKSIAMKPSNLAA
jgi:hypothetical protein